MKLRGLEVFKKNHDEEDASPVVEILTTKELLDANGEVPEKPTSVTVRLHQDGSFSIDTIGLNRPEHISSISAEDVRTRFELVNDNGTLKYI